MAVAIVGYRVYPAGNTSSQVFDLTAAHSLLSQEFPDLCGPDRRRRPVGYCACGHSSGAHIALMMLVNQVKHSLLTNELEDTSLARSSCAASFDVFLGLSGPYDISNHFDYEAARGVEGTLVVAIYTSLISTKTTLTLILSRIISNEGMQWVHPAAISQ